MGYFCKIPGSRLPIEGGEAPLLKREVFGTIENPESVLHHINLKGETCQKLKNMKKRNGRHR
ncbi:MAG: hypothetical protein CM15mV85_140 [uncultured marine virus]|nr:MAG: hypothetical protein CM15mV85_140 [uncultured marine virus]